MKLGYAREKGCKRDKLSWNPKAAMETCGNQWQQCCWHKRNICPSCYACGQRLEFDLPWRTTLIGLPDLIPAKGRFPAALCQIAQSSSPLIIAMLVQQGLRYDLLRLKSVMQSFLHPWCNARWTWFCDINIYRVLLLKIWIRDWDQLHKPWSLQDWFHLNYAAVYAIDLANDCMPLRLVIPIVRALANIGIKRSLKDSVTKAFHKMTNVGPRILTEICWPEGIMVRGAAQCRQFNFDSIELRGGSFCSCSTTTERSSVQCRAPGDWVGIDPISHDIRLIGIELISYDIVLVGLNAISYYIRLVRLDLI